MNGALVAAVQDIVDYAACGSGPVPSCNCAQYTSDVIGRSVRQCDGMTSAALH